MGNTVRGQPDPPLDSDQDAENERISVTTYSISRGLPSASQQLTAACSFYQSVNSTHRAVVHSFEQSQSHSQSTSQEEPVKIYSSLVLYLPPDDENKLEWWCNMTIEMIEGGAPDPFEALHGMFRQLHAWFDRQIKAYHQLRMSYERFRRAKQLTQECTQRILDAMAKYKSTEKLRKRMEEEKIPGAKSPPVFFQFPDDDYAMAKWMAEVVAGLEKESPDPVEELSDLLEELKERRDHASDVIERVAKVVEKSAGDETKKLAMAKLDLNWRKTKEQIEKAMEPVAAALEKRKATAEGLSTEVRVEKELEGPPLHVLGP